MAVTRREYIFCAFLSSVLCVLLIIVAIASNSWIVSSATAEVVTEDSQIKYGLFRGELVLNDLATPNYNTLYMTCVPDLGVCAVSCKTESSAREAEVRALAMRYRPSPACTAITDVDTSDLWYPHPVKKEPLNMTQVAVCHTSYLLRLYWNNNMKFVATAPVISFGLYASTVVFLFLFLVVAVVAAGLAIINATMNPTKPVFGIPGCLWSNVVAAGLGFLVLMMFGIYWATSGLKKHLALSYIALGLYEAKPSLGYSYWLLIASVLCSLINVGLLQLRNYFLERDPPPPTIKVENHSDGTIFLY